MDDNAHIPICEPVNITISPPLSSYERNKPLLWSTGFVCIVISIICIIGNGMVIYVSHQTRNTGRFNYLDGVVKSLAVTDFLFGLIGIPVIITTYYLGKQQLYGISKLKK